MRTRIHVIRHADVENPHRLLYGHLPGFQLSALGRAQAAAVGVTTAWRYVNETVVYDTGQVGDEGRGFAMNEFRTSTGAEIRFFMPVLNVPFRLIFADNPQRAGVLDNNLRPAKKLVFRFAVGTTF